MATRPGIVAKRKQARAGKAKMLSEAADYERRAATITHMIAQLDEERQRLLLAAFVLRRIEAGQLGGEG